MEHSYGVYDILKGKSQGFLKERANSVYSIEFFIHEFVVYRGQFESIWGWAVSVWSLEKRDRREEGNMKHHISISWRRECWIKFYL